MAAKQRQRELGLFSLKRRLREISGSSNTGLQGVGKTEPDSTQRR